MKTKADLLRAMGRDYACGEALLWVREQRVSAEAIGLRCGRPEWMIWFLWKRLDSHSRQLFAMRLGIVDQCCVLDMQGSTRPVHAYETMTAADLPRAVINDCWRAWCRSKP